MSRLTPTLSRHQGQRRLLIRGLATALVMEEKITTTKPKAKSLVPYFERLVSKAKADSLTGYRALLTGLDTEIAAKKVRDDLAKRFKSRQGGYVSVKPAEFRLGDNVQLVRVSLTEPAAAPAKVAEPKLPAQAKVNAKAKVRRSPK